MIDSTGTKGKLYFFQYLQNTSPREVKYSQQTGERMISDYGIYKLEFWEITIVRLKSTLNTEHKYWKYIPQGSPG